VEPFSEVLMTQEQKKLDSEHIAYYWRRSEPLVALDKKLKDFKSDNWRGRKDLWLDLLLEGLGLSYAGLGEKLNCNRPTIFRMCQRENEGAITIASMQKIANALDCEFEYGFVPNGHNSFAEMLVHKTLPFVQNPQVRNWRGADFQDSATFARAYATRIKAFLSKPTGYGKIWQLKKALKRKNYSWVWLTYR
jgi:hypothetical protein